MAPVQHLMTITRLGEGVGAGQWVPDLASISVGALSLTALAAVLVFWRRLDILIVLPIMALAGLGWSLATGAI